ncbi:MAG: heme lyase CcmF/NrfE family subunit [Microthrixaceae bacterium]|nr:heme lyase CcmF/NrfE family subunit [Microthrixaceae bacterium]
MLVALGNAGLTFALLACVAGVVMARRGQRRDDAALSASVRPIAWLSVMGVGIAVVAMQIALLSNDTSVEYVTKHGSSLTPFPFDVATMWSALEGSILMWGMLLAIYTAAVAVKFRRQLHDALASWAMIVMFAVTAFFLVLMLVVSPVFRSVTVAAGFDGPGPNPLLQNHILVAFHPPMLYLGYVGFTVPFAFAVAALITGRLGEGWLTATRRWTLFSWGFLTAGIITGAWWSYEVSGWGGYWVWDPVENVSFIPWLTGTAYLHSVMVQERRGMLRVWNLTLVCSTFALTILGTFLSRSGVVQSVHAFSDGNIGPVLLGFFALIVAVCVGLIGWRGDRLRSPGAIDSPMSREGAFLANNLVFAAFAFVVLLGTVFPLIVEAVNSDRVSVGAPFFDRMATPIGLVMLFLMAVAPVLPWRAATTELLGQRLWWPAWSAIGALAISLAVGARGLAPLLAFGLAGFAAGSVARQLTLASRRHGWRGFVGRANGGMVVHLGVIVIAVALAASQSFVRQGEFTLDEGESARVAGHRFTYVGSRVVQQPNRQETRVRIRIDGGDVYEPSMNRYTMQAMNLSRPSVKVTPTKDLYLNLTREPTAEDPTIRIRIVVEPLILWLWIGGTIMVIGTALSAFPGRRRNPLAPVSTAVGDGREAAEPAPGESAEVAG